eukprot:scaffold22139_cov146-Isochrysis_galbana.AAC.4
MVHTHTSTHNVHTAYYIHIARKAKAVRRTSGSPGVVARCRGPACVRLICGSVPACACTQTPADTKYPCRLQIRKPQEVPSTTYCANTSGPVVPDIRIETVFKTQRKGAANSKSKTSMRMHHLGHAQVLDPMIKSRASKHKGTDG